MERWVFLRGLARRQEHWGGFLSQFAALRPQDEIEALDLAGNGTELNRRAFTQISQYVEDLRQRSRILKKGPVRLVAISLGGMVAAEWVSRHPEELLSAHLINTSDRRHSALWQRLRPNNLGTILRILVQNPHALERERRVLEMVSNLPAGERAKWAEVFAALEPCSASNFLRQIWAAARFEPSLVSPQVPLMLLSGAGDRFVDPQCSKNLARAWGVELRVHPTAGHDLPLDAPEWVLSQILEPGSPGHSVFKSE